MTGVYAGLRSEHIRGDRAHITLRTVLGKAHEEKLKDWEMHVEACAQAEADLLKSVQANGRIAFRVVGSPANCRKSARYPDDRFRGMVVESVRARLLKSGKRLILVQTLFGQERWFPAASLQRIQNGNSEA